MWASGKKQICMLGLVAVLSALLCLTVNAAAREKGCPARISSLAPDARGGQAYRLVYVVPLAIAAFWQFKTSFDNTFLEKNRYIAQHRFINRTENVVLTENRYSVAPEALFRWQTKVYPGRRRLEFKLINRGKSGRHGHKFHYGYIQLTDLGRATRVTQVAYFDFWGAGFWARYPWSGGMQDFLEYTANWECTEALRFERDLVSADVKPSAKHRK